MCTNPFGLQKKRESTPPEKSHLRKLQQPVVYKPRYTKSNFPSGELVSRAWLYFTAPYSKKVVKVNKEGVEKEEEKMVTRCMVDEGQGKICQHELAYNSSTTAMHVHL